MNNPTVRGALYQNVVQIISNTIKSGVWKPGQRLDGEIGLASHFQVSRNCIREALKSLELMGIVESQPGRGTYVSDKALQKIGHNELITLLSEKCTPTELMEARLVIEPQIAYYAAERATPQDIQQLAFVLNHLRTSIKAKTDWSNIGFEFHMAIMKIAKNRILAKFVNSLTNELKAQRAMVYQINPGNEAMIQEHVNIYESIANHCPDQARRAMTYHLHQALQILIDKK